MMIDIIVPVYRPDDKFDRLMNMLYRQILLPHAVILVVTKSGEEGETAKLIERVKKAVAGTRGEKKVELITDVIEKKDFNHGRARNQGISKSKADYVVCMTQDAVPTDDELVRRLLEGFGRYENVACVYARQMAGRNAPEPVRLTQHFNYPKKEQVKNRDMYEALGIKTIFCSNVCCMYSRRIFDALGGFYDPVIFNEDMIFARRVIDAGYQIVYASEAKVEHWHSYSLIQQFRRNFDLAVSQAEHPEVFADLSSQAEGNRMVRVILGHLLKKKKYGQMINYVFLSGAKLLGYKTGQRYQKLPPEMVKKLSMMPGYFEGKLTSPPQNPDGR